MDDRTAALLRQAWPRQLVFLVFITALLFAPAGTLDFWQAWLFLAVFVACMVPLGIYFVRTDPALVERRMRAGPAAEQEPVQKVAIGIVCAALLAMLIVPGFDRRWHWSGVPAWLTVVAWVSLAVALATAGLILFDIFGRGNRQQMLEIVRNNAIFSSKPMKLRRSEQSVESLEKDLIQAQRKEQP